MARVLVHERYLHVVALDERDRAHRERVRAQRAHERDVASCDLSSEGRGDAPQLRAHVREHSLLGVELLRHARVQERERGAARVVEGLEQ